MHADPIVQFQTWFDEAEKSEPTLATAASLATATADGFPSVRMVLCKSWAHDGFRVFTNLGSQKGQELLENPRAALCFHWKSLKRQVRVRGNATRISDSEADAYFAARPRLSQIGAWASHQSQPLENRVALETNVAKFTAKFHIGAVPRPEFWTGFLIAPERIEFWAELPFRLHKRVRYEQADGGFTQTMLYP